VIYRGGLAITHGAAFPKSSVDREEGDDD